MTDCMISLPCKESRQDAGRTHTHRGVKIQQGRDILLLFYCITFLIEPLLEDS